MPLNQTGDDPAAAPCRPQDARDTDCDEHLRRDYFDSSEDEEAVRRFVKPMRGKDLAS
jgi:hypothetical protein